MRAMVALAPVDLILAVAKEGKGHEKVMLTPGKGRGTIVKRDGCVKDKR